MAKICQRKFLKETEFKSGQISTKCKTNKTRKEKKMQLTKTNETDLERKKNYFPGSIYKAVVRAEG